MTHQKMQPSPAKGIVLASIFVLCACLWVPATSLAGKLEDFESDVTQGREESPYVGRDRPEGTEVQAETGFGERMAAEAVEEILDIFIVTFTHMIIDGMHDSLRRVNASSVPGQKRGPGLRRSGEAMLPFFRVDIAYQSVESDIDAIDARTEGGYGPWAVQGRYTRYTERDPDDELHMYQIHGLLRITRGESAEGDIGVGAVIIEGTHTTGGFSITIPLLVHPSDHYGLEIRPSWGFISGNVLQDYDIGILAGWRHVRVRGDTAGLRDRTNPSTVPSSASPSHTDSLGSGVAENCLRQLPFQPHG